jgi:hypothetical protein
VVRVAKGAPAQQPTALERPGHRVDHRDLQCLVGLERRQQPGQARGQHRLARTRRADHQQVVAAGGGDLQGAFGGLLALDAGEIKRVRPRFFERRLGRCQDLRTLEVVDQRNQ